MPPLCARSGRVVEHQRAGGARTFSEAGRVEVLPFLDNAPGEIAGRRGGIPLRVDPETLVRPPEQSISPRLGGERIYERGLGE